MLLTACHPPDARAYAEVRQCHSVLAGSVETIPAPRLRQAGFDPHLLDEHAEGALEDAFQFGANLGMGSIAVINDLNRAKLAYLKSHTAGQIIADLRSDSYGCFRTDPPNA
jgi:hypothetical protein